jgi:hypothetical protein
MPGHDDATDARFVDLWLHGRSAHTQRAYRADSDRFRAFFARTLTTVTHGDVQPSLAHSAASRALRKRQNSVTHGTVDQQLANVGPRLRALRQQRAMTLGDLSAATNDTVSTLSRSDSAQRRPSLKLLLRLAHAYGVAARRADRLTVDRRSSGPGAAVTFTCDCGIPICTNITVTVEVQVMIYDSSPGTFHAGTETKTYMSVCARACRSVRLAAEQNRAIRPCPSRETFLGWRPRGTISRPCQTPGTTATMARSAMRQRRSRGRPVRPGPSSRVLREAGLPVDKAFTPAGVMENLKELARERPELVRGNYAISGMSTYEPAWSLNFSEFSGLGGLRWDAPAVAAPSVANMSNPDGTVGHSDGANRTAVFGDAERERWPRCCVKLCHCRWWLGWADHLPCGNRNGAKFSEQVANRGHLRRNGGTFAPGPSASAKDAFSVTTVLTKQSRIARGALVDDGRFRQM